MRVAHAYACRGGVLFELATHVLDMTRASQTTHTGGNVEDRLRPSPRQNLRWVIPCQNEPRLGLSTRDDMH